MLNQIHMKRFIKTNAKSNARIDLNYIHVFYPHTYSSTYKIVFIDLRSGRHEWFFKTIEERDEMLEYLDEILGVDNLSIKKIKI